MLHLLSQELWGLLASACEQTSGIPKKILDDKAEELRIKNEAQKAIQVSKPVACNGSCGLNITWMVTTIVVLCTVGV